MRSILFYKIISYRKLIYKLNISFKNVSLQILNANIVWRSNILVGFSTVKNKLISSLKLPKILKSLDELLVFKINCILENLTAQIPNSFYNKLTTNPSFVNKEEYLSIINEKQNEFETNLNNYTCSCLNKTVLFRNQNETFFFFEKMSILSFLFTKHFYNKFLKNKKKVFMFNNLKFFSFFLCYSKLTNGDYINYDHMSKNLRFFLNLKFLRFNILSVKKFLKFQFLVLSSFKVITNFL